MPKYSPSENDETMVECAYCGLPVLDRDNDFCDATCRQLYLDEMNDLLMEDV